MSGFFCNSPRLQLLERQMCQPPGYRPRGHGWMFDMEEWKSRGNYSEIVDCVISRMQMEHLKKRIQEVFGNAEKELEVISEVTEEETKEITEFLEHTEITVEHINNGCVFDIIVEVFHGEDKAKVRIANYHTNIVRIEKNGEILLNVPVAGESEEGLTDRSLLDMKSIWDFANTVDIEDIREVIGRQIEYNSAIADEGLKGNYGANIGSVLLDTYGNDVRTRAKARAAAGSDARMNGCELPVVINAGSGNQGMTCSLPVLEYADEYHVFQNNRCQFHSFQQ